MRPKLLFLLFLNFVFISTSYTQNIIPIVKERPADFEYLSAPDSLGIRHQIKMPKTINTNKSSQVSEAKIPYPIIFIHGLNSSSETWDSTTGFMDTNYSFTYGGRFDINLNFDGDKNNVNKNIYPVLGADIAFYSIPTVSNADYYYVNFDVGIDGSFKPNPSSAMYNLSNQSAIAKQGKALQYVVNKVMQLTGKDKVILMGHSMGGLAAREYIQNQDNWQSDNQHHVAKLVTTGTPHGGSNASASFLGTILIGIDNKSEAVRDLRTSYFYSPNAPGVFLFGGVESNSVMNDMLLSNFYNLDVNCNAIIGDNVIGLNRKNLFSTIDYSCIIGTLLGSSDGVVNTISADLNTYYQNITRNVFKVSTSHSSLPDQNYQNIQGLDEPNNYDTAYGIGFNKIYYGFVTEQSLNSPSNVDYDDYTFTLTSGGQVNINIGVPLSVNLNARIVDVNGTIIGSNFSSNGTNIISFSKNLNAGKYYLEIYGLPSTTTYLSPYVFNLTVDTFSLPPTIFSLNASNLKLQVESNSCIGKKTGKISATFANPNYSYQVTVTGVNRYSNTQTVPVGTGTWSITGLEKGKYTICFAIASEPTQKQCFDIEVTEPDPLSVYAKVDNSTGIVNLAMLGAKNYIVSVNGKATSVSSSNFSTILPTGLNSISVTTDKDCQGVYQQDIFISEKAFIYPNPTFGVLHIFVGGTENTITYTLTDLSGATVKKATLSVGETREVEVDLSAIPQGNYIININSKTVSQSFKVIKL